MKNIESEAVLFLAEGFEEIEASTPIAYLRHAGVQLITISVTGKREVAGAHGQIFVANELLEECEFTDSVKILILPGGVPGAENLSKVERLNKLVTCYFEQGKWVAAICAAPLVLGRIGLLKNKSITCYPGFEPFMKGAKVLKKTSWVDGNLITAIGPGGAMEFSERIVTALRSEKEAKEMTAAMMYRVYE